MSKNNLDEIVSRYKKELINKYDANSELEIRFKNIDYQTFAIIYKHFLQNTKESDISVTQMISSLMRQKSGTNQLQTTNIRNIYFKDGESFKKTYSNKTPLLIPYKDHNLFGISYNVVLSLEKDNILSFISDESAIIRIKNRVSFLMTEGIFTWRLDMSVVKEVLGSNAGKSLTTIVGQMFRNHTVTPNNLLTLFNEDKISQKIYKYEIELELINNDQIKSNDIIAIAKKILFIANPDYMSHITLQSKIYEVAKYIIKAPGLLQQFQNNLGLKQLLPKVQALTRYDYRNIYPVYGYYLTDKADGIRAIGICNGTKGFIISDTLRTYDKNYNAEANILVTIVDAELIDEVLYIFDAIIINGNDISQLSFDLRLAMLPEAAELLRVTGIKAEVKPFILITDNIEASVKEIYNRKRPYKIDGLIFVEPGKSYMTTKNYKWKRIEDNTIDFLVKKAPKSILGQRPFITREKYTLYFLFVGISYDLFHALGLHRCIGYGDIFDDAKFASSSAYFPIQFCPSNAPLAYIYYHPDSDPMIIENNVVEFSCTTNCSASDGGPLIGWQPIRIRDDRRKDLESKIYYGNDYKIAEITWINYLDPFPLEQLWINVSPDDYFSSNKSKIYNAQTSVLSFLKHERIMSYSHQNWIVDIGSGKGQDLGRYFNAKIKNVIAIDNDKASLSELIRRKFTFATERKKNSSTNVYVVLADMTSDYESILSRIYNVLNVQKDNIDSVICNLSIHYYIYTNSLLTNFINFTNSLLKPNGYLVITCFFGEAIFDLLKNLDEGQTWTTYDNEVIKYSIKKMYSSTKLENMGQKIGVVLPFSRGEYYEEYLVNTEYLITELKKYGFKLVGKKSVSNILPDFKLQNPSISSNLSNDDITYLSLYGELEFQKGKR